MVIFGTDQLQRREQAYGLLARGARVHWGLDPLPPMARGPQGKPYFPGAEDRAFNLSHSGSLALCALDDRPVGVDIQLVGPHRPGLPARVCAPEELAWLEEGELWERFALLWALKECRAKQSGLGLTGTIARIRVPLPRRVGEEALLDGLRFRTYAGPGWRAAACGLSLPPEQIFWEKNTQFSLDSPRFQ